VRGRGREGAGPEGPGVELRPVAGPADRRAFIRLPWRIYRDDPHWVPPLLLEVAKVLDPSRHPFHAHADVQYFLARRGRVVVGRIAVFVNHRFNEFHASRIAHFGFFECVNDGEVAEALLEGAADWGRKRGMELLQGPFNFSTNDELHSPGVLVDGFQYPPVLLMAHTPPYYAALLEGCGFVKARDLLSYLAEGTEPPDRLVQGVGRLRRSKGVVVRPLVLSDLPREIARVKEIYNSAWERNWGFVPMSDAELDHMAASLKPVLDPRLCALAEVQGEPVAFALGLPDLNQVLRHLNGRLLPLGWLKYLWYRRRIDTLRVLTLGVRPEHRHRGIDAMLILHLYLEGLKAGFTRAECSWILEDNLPMRRGLERIGARAYKTYRVYEKPLRGSG
jgi:GNAT superfamily N-acetyltransferase